MTDTDQVQGSEDSAVSSPAAASDQQSASNAAAAAVTKPSYTQKGFIVDKGALRDIDEVKNIVAQSASIAETQKQKESQETAIAQKGFKFWFKKSIKASKSIDPKSIQTTIPVLIDPDPIQKAGTTPWVPIEIDNPRERGVKDPVQIERILKVVKPGDKGYFNKRKLVESEFNISTGQKLTGDINISDKMDEAASKAGFLASAAMTIGKGAIKHSRYVRNKINDKIQVSDEEQGESTAQPESSAEPNESNDKNWITERVSGAIDKVKEKLGFIEGASLKVKSANLTGVGLIAQFTGNVKIYDNPIQATVGFKINTHDDYALVYLGSEIDGIPGLKIEKFGASFNLSIGKFVHDPSNEGMGKFKSLAGNATLSLFEQTASVSWNSIEYDADKKEFSSELNNIILQLTYEDTIAKLTINKPKIKANALDFESAEGAINEFTILEALKVNDIKLVLKKEGDKYQAKGSMNIATTEPKKIGALELNKLQADLYAEYNSTDESFVNITNGNLDIALLGQNASVKNFRYSSLDQTGLADTFKLDLNYLEKTISIEVLNPSFSANKGLDFDMAKGVFPGFTLLGGVEIGNIEVYLKNGKTYHVTGIIPFSVAEGSKIGPTTLGKFQGNLVISWGGEQDFVRVYNGQIEINIFDQTGKFSNVVYDSRQGELKADNADIELNIADTKAIINIAEPRITEEKGFDFTSAEGKIDEFNALDVITFKDIDVKAESNGDGTHKVTGEAKAKEADKVKDLGILKINALNGNILVTKDQSSTDITITSGNLNMSILEQEVVLSNFNYSSATEKGEADSFNLNLKYGEQPIVISVKNPAFDPDNGITFSEAKGNLPDISILGGINFNNIEVFLKKGQDFHVTGISHFNVPEGSKVGPTTLGKFEGNLVVSWGGEEKFVRIYKGNLDVNILDQTGKFSNVVYDSRQGELKADNADIELNIADTKAIIKIVEPKVKEGEGFDFTSAEGKIDEFNALDVITFKDIDVKAESNGDGTHKVTGEAKAKEADKVKDLGILKINALNGNILVTKDQSSTDITITGGNLNMSILEQEVVLSNFNYSSATEKGEADSFDLNLKYGEQPIVISVKNPAFDPDNGITFSEAKGNLPDISILGGINFNNIEVFLKKGQDFHVTGVSHFNVPEGSKVGPTTLGKFEGNLVVSWGGERNYIRVYKGNLDLNVLEQNASFSNITFDSEKGILTADNSIFEIAVGETKASINIVKPSLTEQEGFNYESATGKIPEINILNDTIVFKNVDAILLKEDNNYNLDVDSDVSLLEGKEFGILKIKTLNGHIKYKKTAGDTTIDLTKGNASADIFGQTVDLKGVNYKSGESKIAADSVTTNFEFNGTKVGITITNPSFSKTDGFNFTEAKGTASEMGIGSFAKFNDIVVAIRKNGENYDIHGEGDFKIGTSSIPEAKLTSTGKLTVDHKDDKTDIKISGANVNIAILGQSMDAKDASYDSATGTLTAATIDFNINFFGENYKPDVKGFKIAKDTGLDFDSATLPLNDKQIEFGFLTVTGKNLKVEKSDSGGYKAIAEGGLALNIAGSPIKGSLKGDLSYDFKSKKKDANVNEGTISVDNPLSQFEIPKHFLGGLWPIDVSVGIPVFPGLAVEVGFYVEGGVRFAKTIDLTLKKNGNNLEITIGSGVSGKIGAGIFVGAQVGNAFILSLSVRLRAGGELAISTDASYTTNLALGQKAGADKKFEPGSFLYDTNVELKLKAGLQIVGRLLYVFKAEYTKDFAEYSFGHYRFTNKEKKPKKGLAPTKDKMTDEESVKGKMVKSEFSDMTLEQIENIDQQTRFKKADVEAINEKYDLNESDSVQQKFSLLSSYGRMMDNRIDYTKLRTTLDKNIHSDESYNNQDKILPEMENLGEAFHTKSDFVSKYNSLIQTNENSNSSVPSNLKSEHSKINSAHSKRSDFFNKANDIKSTWLHSGFRGDEKAQSSAAYWSIRRNNFRSAVGELKTLYNENNSAGNFYLKDREENFLKSILKSDKSQNKSDVSNIPSSNTGRG